MELENHSTDNDIFKIALQLYYNPSIWPDEFSDISTIMLKNIHDRNVNSMIERGIIATFSFFVNKHFTIVTNQNDFAEDLEPAIPDDWTNSDSMITIMTRGGVERSVADYFVQKKNQTFELHFSSSSRTQEVRVILMHLQNYRTFSVGLFRSELDGLSDPQHCMSFALHIVCKFAKAMRHPIQKADENLPPSRSQPSTPIWNEEKS